MNWMRQEGREENQNHWDLGSEELGEWGGIKWDGKNSFAGVDRCGNQEFCWDVLSVRCINYWRSIWQKPPAPEFRFLSINEGLFSWGFSKCSPQISSSRITWKLLRSSTSQVLSYNFWIWNSGSAAGNLCFNEPSWGFTEVWEPLLKITLLIAKECLTLRLSHIRLLCDPIHLLPSS